MPIYEYECGSCHHQFEMIQKINSEPSTLCPHCYENTAIRLISAAGFQLKGNGWYATDFKNKGGDTKSVPEKAAAKSGDAKSTKAD